MGGFQDQLGCGSCIQGFLPAGRAQTPAVPRLQPGESVFRNRRGEVIADLLRKGEELGGHHGADRVQAGVMGAGLATAIAEESGHRIKGAGQQFPAQNIAGVSVVSGGHDLTLV